MYSWSADFGWYLKLNSWKCVIIIDLRLLHIQAGVLHLLTGLACKSAWEITFLSKFPMKFSWDKILISYCPRQFVLLKSCCISTPKHLYCIRLLGYYFACCSVFLGGKRLFAYFPLPVPGWNDELCSLFKPEPSHWVTQRWTGFQQRWVIYWPSLRRQEEVPLVVEHVYAFLL